MRLRKDEKGPRVQQVWSRAQRGWREIVQLAERPGLRYSAVPLTKGKTSDGTHVDSQSEGYS